MTTLKELLKNELTSEEMENLTTAYDIIGDIIVIEIEDELLHKEKLIGRKLLEMHKNVKTVCRKAGAHSGKFRTQKLKIIAGKRTKETVHKESGCRLKLHVEKCYFSVRSGTERLRIAKLVKPNEDILVMFSGVAPFVCVIGKNAKYNSITGIEMNPIAHKYAVENIAMNKIKNAEAICGDVRKIVPKLVKKGKKYDRILMPLPKTSEEFLDIALLASKKGTKVHLYGFMGEDEFASYIEKVKSICMENKRKINIEGIVKCGQFSPRIFRICLDFEVL